MNIRIMIIVLLLAISCGGSKQEANKETQSRFQAVMQESEIVGYNYVKDGIVIFIPVDEMPPAAPVGLE